MASYKCKECGHVQTETPFCHGPMEEIKLTAPLSESHCAWVIQDEHDQVQSESRGTHTAMEKRI